MPKKMLEKIEEGATAASVALECAAFLDAGLEEQLGPPTAEEEGLAARAARRLRLLRHHFEAASRSTGTSSSRTS